jgi:hypothetical protein
MKYIYVFKTNLRYKKDLLAIKPLLDGLEPIQHWNLDRDDRDKILRVETSKLCQDDITNMIKSAGYDCEELQD